MSVLRNSQPRILEDPPLAKWFFNNTRSALLWLPLRLWLGVQWIEASSHKIGNPAWFAGGSALQGFWTNAVTIPAEGRPPIAFDWYRSFIQFLLDTEAYTWFAKVIAYSELVVGIALVLGAFTGIAALIGGFMNWNFLMAGAASTNPVLFLIAIGLVLAWKVSGYFGADFFLLRWIGVPWQWELPPSHRDLQPGEIPAD